MGSGPLNHKTSSSTEDIIAEARRRVQTQQQKSISARKRNRAMKLNQGVLWFSRHWLAIFSLLVALYTIGAVLAPVLMKAGKSQAGQILYKFYGVSCHQYPFRSWFLFGPESTRPLETPTSVVDMNRSSAFIGNETVGYKVALCQRDMAIYGIIFFVGLGYGIRRKRHRVPPLPLWMFFVFGIMPIMLDGGIQWLSYVLTTLFPGWVTYPFETIPLMRTLTGALFGAGLVAVTYPYVEEYFEDIRNLIKEKLDTNQSESITNLEETP